MGTFLSTCLSVFVSVCVCMCAWFRVEVLFVHYNTFPSLLPTSTSREHRIAPAFHIPYTLCGPASWHIHSRIERSVAGK
uniref:Putative secreted protein n=1 Tax=Anopheles darlingi TaxID=43151 RepID=A0A2M4D0A2_ANODA